MEEFERLHEEAKNRFSEQHQELIANHNRRMDSLRKNFESLRQAHGASMGESQKADDASST